MVGTEASTDARPGIVKDMKYVAQNFVADVPGFLRPQGAVRLRAQIEDLHEPDASA